MAEDKPKAEEEEKPIPAGLASLAGWRKTKDTAVEETSRRMGDTIELAETLLKQFMVVHRRVNPINPNDPRIITGFMMLLCHKHLLNCLDLLVQRQIQPAMAVLRPAIELAAEAAKIGDNPKLAFVWLKRDEAEGEYNEAFRKKFPEGHPLTGPLYKDYNVTTGYGSHGGPTQIAEALEFSKNEGAVLYFCPDDDQLRRALVHFTYAAVRILRVYAVILKDFSKKPIDEFLALWKSAVEVHGLKYQGLFPNIKAGANPTVW